MMNADVLFSQIQTACILSDTNVYTHRHKLNIF